MTAAELAKLDEAAQAHHLSRSDIILHGLRRCMRDGGWTHGQVAGYDSRDPVSPPPHVVTLSQILIGVSMSLEGIFAGKRRSSKTFLEAEAMLADAKRMLAELLEEQGCS